MYDYQQEPDNETIPTVDDFFDRVDYDWAQSDLQRAQTFKIPLSS